MHPHLGEEGLDAGDVFRDRGARIEFEIGPEGDEPEIATDPFRLGLDLLAEALRLQGAGGGEDALEVAEFGQPLDRGLRTDAFESGNIIRGVTHEREIVGDALWRDAELLGHGGGVEPPPAERRIRRRRWGELDDWAADALAEILVRADDHAGGARRGKNAHGGRDQVVGFDAAPLEDLEAEQGREAFDLRQLEYDVLRSLVTLSFVLRQDFQMAI